MQQFDQRFLYQQQPAGAAAQPLTQEEEKLGPLPDGWERTTSLINGLARCRSVWRARKSPPHFRAYGGLAGDCGQLCKDMVAQGGNGSANSTMTCRWMQLAAGEANSSSAGTLYEELLLREESKDYYGCPLFIYSLSYQKHQRIMFCLVQVRHATQGRQMTIRSIGSPLTAHNGSYGVIILSSRPQPYI
ncbi:hypothetical protein RvY_15186 [Ramazzottius varieornatus]|uniref:Uncharacterized protein n=1 Tax=Ramazzottius varieornatus TaxID=947166 RepID=A0A1D1W0Y7_RAMVA|nr:hypothetical protein RvY_15186 [Ramazzottius varieornatus]